ncbi:metallophosphoesterase family protein [Lacticigenium naphthae]|uniref:metallophosphoesterase family protein n=1 Tax=Lacticigenium naphthae TaxID=515351 RepID=UPI000411D42A|nr:metallophosphoesterase family protein [Lacticigenium naphthae]
MKNEFFVVGDIHGEITLVKKLLEHWNSQTQQLLFLGDLGDRGENPKECFELVQNLVQTEGAICLKGNHEDMLINYLENPERHYANYLLNGGIKTIQTFLAGKEMDKADDNPEGWAKSIKAYYPKLLPFLKELPLYYEWGNYLFVHAGVNLMKSNWQDSDEQDFVWIREGFFDQPNNTDKIIVFGHTVTSMLHKNRKDTSIWDSGDGKIGLDGGAVYGGTLHGVVFDKEGMKEHFSIPK